MVRTTHLAAKREATRGRPARALDEKDTEFILLVKRKPHWPNVSIEECRELYLRSYGSEFRKGVIAHDKIAKAIDNAR